jgi:magnesium chelatase family protein
MLVAAMNPCPCGYYGDPQRECTCGPSVIARYHKRISGPLLDRIDMFVEVPRVEYEKLVQSQDGEGSAQARERVERARQTQRSRFQDTPHLSNADMGPAEVWEFCQVEDAAKGLLQAAMRQLALTARGFHRVLKVARTIADLAGSESIGVVHVAEALQYRPRGQM